MYRVYWYTLLYTTLYTVHSTHQTAEFGLIASCQTRNHKPGILLHPVITLTTESQALSTLVLQGMLHMIRTCTNQNRIPGKLLIAEKRSFWDIWLQELREILVYHHIYTLLWKPAMPTSMATAVNKLLSLNSTHDHQEFSRNTALARVMLNNELENCETG